MSDAEKIRLDKWLWAARFFKTRSLASDAIDGGKVHYDGFRAKPSKEVRLGAILRITRGDEVWEVVVRALSMQRRGAPEAACCTKKRQKARRNAPQQPISGRWISASATAAKAAPPNVSAARSSSFLVTEPIQS